MKSPFCVSLYLNRPPAYAVNVSILFLASVSRSRRMLTEVLGAMELIVTFIPVTLLQLLIEPDESHTAPSDSGSSAVV